MINSSNYLGSYATLSFDGHASYYDNEGKRIPTSDIEAWSQLHPFLQKYKGSPVLIQGYGQLEPEQVAYMISTIKKPSKGNYWI